MTNTFEVTKKIEALRKKHKERTTSRVIKKLVGLNICYYRSARGWTQDKLANKIKLSRVSIANIERGRHETTLFNIYSISKALDVYPEQLLDVFPNGEKK